MSAQNIKKVKVDSEFSASSSVRMKEAAEKYRVAMSDEKSRDQLIEDYLPLVKSIVSRMRFHFPDHYEIEDMYGIAVKALIVSVNQFNPSKGKSFGNYAALRIKGSLLDECLPALQCLGKPVELEQGMVGHARPRDGDRGQLAGGVCVDMV